MKLFNTKKIVITGVVAVVLGSVLFFTGYKMGGLKNFISFQNGLPVAVKTSQNTKSQTFSNSIKNLKINSDALQITVQVGNEFSVKSQLSNERELSIIASGDSATISTQEKFNNILNFNFFLKNPESIVITVPSSSQLKHLELNADASTIHFSDLILTNLSGKTDASSFTIDNVGTDSLKLRADASNLSFTHLIVQYASSLSMDASHLKLFQSTYAGLFISGDATSFKYHNEHKNLPFNSGEADRALKISGDASDITVSY